VLVRVTHTIDYRFEHRVEHASLELRLSPRSEHTEVRYHQVLVEPGPAELREARDASDNVVLRADVDAATAALSVSAITTLSLGDTASAPDLEAELARLLLNGAPERPQKRLAGLCRERSEKAVLAATARGFACRFVSGYVVGQQGSTDLHMWISVEMGSERWVDWDPTRAGPADTHLALARGPSPEDVAPVGGSVVAAGRYRMLSRVLVQRLE
jgi:transglutaminase-like putative cysteine protease